MWGKELGPPAEGRKNAGGCTKPVEAAFFNVEEGLSKGRQGGKEQEWLWRPAVFRYISSPSGMEWLLLWVSCIDSFDYKRCSEGQGWRARRARMEEQGVSWAVGSRQ